MFFHPFFFSPLNYGPKRPYPDCFPLKNESGVSRSCKAFLVFKVFLKPISRWVAELYGGFAVVCEILLRGTGGFAIPNLDRQPGQREPGAARPRGAIA